MNLDNMNLDNILVTGASGMVGSNIDFGIKPTSKELNVCDTHSIERYISKLRRNTEYTGLTAILHLVATNLHESEQNHQKAIDVNINGTANMVALAQRHQIPFIYVSSGAVFSSQDINEVFNEHNTIPTPNCMYGHTKYSAEKIVQLYADSIIVRTGWLFGSHTHNKFVETAINNLILGREVRGSTNFCGSPTYVKDFVIQLKHIICDNAYDKPRIHHVVNSGYATGYEIAIEVAKIMKKPLSLIVPVSAEYVPNASTQSRSTTEKLSSIYESNKMRDWREALYTYITGKENPPQPRKYWSNRKKCRLCDSDGQNLNIFYKMTPTPLANHFVETPVYQEVIPLDICVCTNCAHIQLLQIVDPAYQYSNYFYVSSTSTTMTQHLQRSALKFAKELHLDLTDNILEIGANDGVCVKYLLDRGYTNVIGVDPAKNINDRHDLPIICDFFGKNILQHPQIQDKIKIYKLIFGFHCCANIEDIQYVFSTVDQLLDDADGRFIIEVGYFYQVYMKKQFDVIYHEHIDYHTVTAMRAFSAKYNLRLYAVEENDIQGGSIQFYFCRTSSEIATEGNVYDCLEKERILFSNTRFVTEKLRIDTGNLNKWKNDVILNGKDIYNILNSFVNLGKTVVGYGASAKLTTFMYQFNLTGNTIKYIIDDSIYKQHHYTPATHIPILPIDVLDTERADYIVIFCWNFADEVIKKLSKYRDNGLRVIVPFPEIRIL